MSDAFFRAAVGAVLVDETNEVLTLRRRRGPEHIWQMPQGAIWFGETPTEALYRELETKLSLASGDFSILGATGWHMYEIPRQYRNNKVGWGQIQQWFLCRLSVHSTSVAPNMLEFEVLRWVKAREVAPNAAAFKKELYARVIAELKIDTQRDC
jgi:putative (di)nucleoside polyphosphate hydrolase